MHALAIFFAGMMIWAISASIYLFFSRLMIPQRMLINLIHRHPRRSTKLLLSALTGMILAELLGSDSSVSIVYAGIIGSVISIIFDFFEQAG